MVKSVWTYPARAMLEDASKWRGIDSVFETPKNCFDSQKRKKGFWNRTTSIGGVLILNVLVAAAFVGNVVDVIVFATSRVAFEDRYAGRVRLSLMTVVIGICYYCCCFWHPSSCRCCSQHHCCCKMKNKVRLSILAEEARSRDRTIRKEECEPMFRERERISVFCKMWT